MIAKRLNIEEKEFMFYGRGKKSCHDYEPDTLFAKVRYSEESIKRLEAGAPPAPFSMRLRDNPEYKGKTGKLRWILAQDIEGLCMDLPEEDWDYEGMLARKFEKCLAVYKAQQEDQQEDQQETQQEAQEEAQEEVPTETQVADDSENAA
ncbi:hypothetical protein H4S07_002308 [Coemansia furcata]|uniref:Uncharacterized protein n=1 Tax=Coemansia furcata TaxID=417177 RepID=A0ACC1LL43_9FUNG|nr:hypothetical protein H4S07_002308 [Coemansia furcata]